MVYPDIPTAAKVLYSSLVILTSMPTGRYGTVPNGYIVAFCSLDPDSVSILAS
jgi:hypothetical protein